MTTLVENSPIIDNHSMSVIGSVISNLLPFCQMYIKHPAHSSAACSLPHIFIKKGPQSKP